MLAEADRIGKVTEQMCGRAAIEFERFGAIDASARQYLVCQFVEHSRLEEFQSAPRWGQAQVDCVIEEQLQPLPFVGAEAVTHIIP